MSEPLSEAAQRHIRQLQAVPGYDPAKWFDRLAHIPYVAPAGIIVMARVVPGYGGSVDLLRGPGYTLTLASTAGKNTITAVVERPSRSVSGLCEPPDYLDAQVEPRNRTGAHFAPFFFADVVVTDLEGGGRFMWSARPEIGLPADRSLHADATVAQTVSSLDYATAPLTSGDALAFCRAVSTVDAARVALVGLANGMGLVSPAADQFAQIGLERLLPPSAFS